MCTIPGSARAAAREHDQHDADDHRERTDHGPFRLAGHEASGQHVDPLKDPDAAHEQEEDAGNHHEDSHGLDRVADGGHGEGYMPRGGALHSRAPPFPDATPST